MQRKKTQQGSTNSRSKSEIYKEPTEINTQNVLIFSLLHLLALYALLVFDISRSTFILGVILYIITAFSLGAGYHRLYAHGSFNAVTPFKFFVLFFASGAFMGPVTKWVRYHRAHHKFINEKADPMGISKGFFHAHMGWLCLQQPDNFYEQEIDTSDIEKDPMVALQETYYLPFAVASGFIVPAIIASFWGDFFGGIVAAGALRIVILQHAFFSTTSFAHVVGSQKFSDEHTARNNHFVSFFTLGEGAQNFNHEFPKDYRFGIKMTHFDLTGIIIQKLSLIGVTYYLKSTKVSEILKSYIIFKQRKINEKKVTLDFGPEPSSLPVWSWSELDEKAKKGTKFVVIDGIVHDVNGFLFNHPGGIKILEARLGKDATLAFNGALYRHSKAARNLLATLRIGRLSDEEISSRTESDHFHREDE